MKQNVWLRFRVRKFKSTTWSVEVETTSEIIRTGIGYPTYKIHWRDWTGRHTSVIGARPGDKIEIYRGLSCMFFVYWNKKMRYAGVDIYRGAEYIISVFREGNPWRWDRKPHTYMRFLVKTLGPEFIEMLLEQQPAYKRRNYYVEKRGKARSVLDNLKSNDRNLQSKKERLQRWHSAWELH